MAFGGAAGIFGDLGEPAGFPGGDQYIPPPNVEFEPKDFMSNFNPSMVTNPGATSFPAGFDPAKHPTWVVSNDATLLICPVMKRAIAIYDYQFNAPWFVSNGFLRINSINPSLYQFCFDPHHEPYPQTKGN